MTDRAGIDKSEPFVSVLTPVYNQGEFIEECIQSVLNQSYSNWEYVIVNNKSTDNTAEVIDKYNMRDPRIRVYTNEKHLPQMQNLNHAFRQISPESNYCKVIHADDFLFKHCLRQMVEVAESYPTVGIVSSYRLDDRKVGLGGLPYPSHFNDGREIARDYFLGNSYYFGAPSSLLIRTSLILKRDRVYDESYLQSDISTCLDMLQESDFGFVHQVLTYTRRHGGTVTNNQALKDSGFMLGYFKIDLDYGPVFLSDEELDNVLKKREEIFYIQFARNILHGPASEAYVRHSKELQSINYTVKRGKLLKYVIRETILKVMRNLGIECSRIQSTPKSESTPSDTTKQNGPHYEESASGLVENGVKGK